METSAFVGGWGCSFVQQGQSICGSKVTTARTRQAQCATPRMALVKSEELEVLFESGDYRSAKYQLDIVVPGDATKQSRRESIRRIKANANFDGFRKGTIPPFIMSQVNEFVLRDCIEDEINAACKELNLEYLEGDASDPVFDFKATYKRFEMGKDLDVSFEIALQKKRDKGDAPKEENVIEAAVSELPDIKS